MKVLRGFTGYLGLVMLVGTAAVSGRKVKISVTLAVPWGEKSYIFAFHFFFLS